MPLGNHYYMIVATEAYRSAGNSRVTISGGGSTPPTTPSPPVPPTPTNQPPTPTGGSVSDVRCPPNNRKKLTKGPVLCPLGPVRRQRLERPQVLLSGHLPAPERLVLSVPLRA